MAASDVLSTVSVSLHEYNLAEQELQDHILKVYGTNQNELDLFRPSLADQQKIGFFSLDRGSQTEITEVLDLKEMTEVIQILLQDVETLRKDINVTKHVMQADYEAKLQEKSLDLYCRINDKVAALEKMHEDRIDVIRKAYRQQLSDAISRVAVLYNKNLENKISKVKKKQDRESGKVDEKYRDLQNQIQKDETVIHMLRLQLQQYQQNTFTDDQLSRGRNSSSVVMVLDEESVASESPDNNPELDELRERVVDLEEKSQRLQDQLENKKKETFKLSNDIIVVKEQLQKEKNVVKQLENDKLELKQSMEQSKVSNRRLIDEEADKQQRDMEKIMEEKLRQAKEEIELKAQKQAQVMSEKETVRIKELEELNKKLEEQVELEKKKEKVVEKKVEKPKTPPPSDESILKSEISRLKKEIERIHRTWEKKFAILQQSLHALKDESYLRQTLQRQAANLHQASVSYAIDSPAGIVPAKIPSANTKKPLPDIGKHVKSSDGSHGDKNVDKDCLSYTVSAPSGRGTTILSVDENQVMSDDNDQDFPLDVKPLPQPPIRNQSESGVLEDGRPTSVSNVVVLPSTNL